MKVIIFMNVDVLYTTSPSFPRYSTFTSEISYEFFGIADSPYSTKIPLEEFLNKLKVINPEDIIYLEECGIDERMKREYAYDLKGKRLFEEKSGNRFHKRITTISALKMRRRFFYLPFILKEIRILSFLILGYKILFYLQLIIKRK